LELLVTANLIVGVASLS